MTMTMISEPEENNNSNSSFTLQELKALAEVDSRLFGFLKLNLPENAKKKALIVRAVRSLEKVLINHEKKKSATSGTKQSKSVEKSPAGASADIQSEDTSQLPSVGNEPKELNIKIYCKLGHFHLLLEDYGKALSAYQIYYTLEDNHWMDPSFLYGLGLVYFHYSAFKCLFGIILLEIVDAMTNIPRTHFIHACGRFRKRVDAVIAADGGFIE